MKNTISKRENLSKIYGVLIWALSVVLMLSANATTCHIIHQPEEPKKIVRFKFIK